MMNDSLNRRKIRRWKISSVCLIVLRHVNDRDFCPSRFGRGHVRKGRLVAAIGICSSAETTHSALHDISPKSVCESAATRCRFWPRKWLREEISRIKIGSAFLCFFRLQRQKKEGNVCTSKKEIVTDFLLKLKNLK